MLLISRLLFISILFSFTRCDLVHCENEVIKEISNGSKTYKAVLFKRDCGATTKSSTQISILPLSQILPNEGGNVFITESENLSTEWKNNTTLLIKYVGHERVFRQDSVYREIKISYQEAH